MIKTKLIDKLRRVTGIQEIITRVFVVGEDVKDLKRVMYELKMRNDDIQQQLTQAVDMLVAERDDIDSLKDTLKHVRESAEYTRAYTKKKPLVTVRIATYNKSEELLRRCLPSVLGQTYKNIEVIIVGDHCTDDTEERIRELNDPRVTFINLSRRSTYPEDKLHRWFVAGSPGMNIGVDAAHGDWIAPIDDDDEFTNDHIEKLLKLALSSKAELVYGSLRQVNSSNGEDRLIYSNPPTLGNFSFQAAMYPRALKFMRYDERSWVSREPGDWNLCRRMLLAGVRTASIKDVVGFLYMHNLDDKKHYKKGK